MKTAIIIPSALLVCFLFSSCATIINGSRQSVTIRSVPPGAAVLINDSLYGKTPLIVDMKRKRKDRHIKLTLDGYEPFETDMIRSVDGWVAGNILIGGVIGLGIDALTGSMYDIHPEQINATLKATSQNTSH